MNLFTILLMVGTLAFGLGYALAWDRGWRAGHAQGRLRLEEEVQLAFERGGLVALQIDREGRAVTPPPSLRLVTEEEEEG